MATLLELVREHVKVWPDGAISLHQSSKGHIHIGVAETGKANDWHTDPVEIAHDRAGSRITREQWETPKTIADLVTAGYLVNLPPAKQVEGRAFRMHIEGEVSRTRGGPIVRRIAPGYIGERVDMPSSEYEPLRASHAAWLSIMSALDEKHPDWATGTTKGTLIERAIKAIKNGN